MRQKIAALVSAIVVGFATTSMAQEKISTIEGSGMLMAVMAYWADPPASPGSNRDKEDKGN